MTIKILGKDSSNKMKLIKHTKKALKAIKDIKIKLEIINNELNRYNITNYPALFINDKKISEGKILTEREIKNYIKILN